MTTQQDTIRLGIDHPDWAARDHDPQPDVAPNLELFVVVVRNADAMTGYPAEFLDVWAIDVASVHQTVLHVLRGRRDDHATDIVGVWATGQRRFL